MFHCLRKYREARRQLLSSDGMSKCHRRRDGSDGRIVIFVFRIHDNSAEKAKRRSRRAGKSAGKFIKIVVAEKTKLSANDKGCQMYGMKFEV